MADKIAEVVEEAVKGAQDQSVKADDTNPQQTVEVPEYLKGDVTAEQYTKMSDEQRTWSKKLYGDYTKKNQEVGELRKLKNDLEANPEKLAHIKKSMTEFDAKKAGLIPEKTSTDEDFLEDATPEQRKAIELLDKRYLDPMKIKDTQIKELQNTVNSLMSDTQVSRRDTLESEIGSLPESMKELGNQYKEQILRSGTAKGGKGLSAEKLIQFHSTTEEYRKAVLTSNPEQSKKQTDKVRDNATSKPQSTVQSQETPEASRLKSRDPRFKKGPVDVSGMLQGFFEGVKRGIPGS